VPGSGDVAVDFESSNGVGESDDTSGPSVVERVVGVGVRCECGVEPIVGPVEFLMMDDAGDGQDLRAGSISFLGVATVAGHSSHITVLFLGPDGGLEGQALLGNESLTIIREVLFDAQSADEQQTESEECFSYSHINLFINPKK